MGKYLVWLAGFLLLLGGQVVPKFGFSSPQAVGSYLTTIGNTTTTGAATSTEFFGGLYPLVDAAFDVGTSTRRWKDAWFSGFITFGSSTVSGASSTFGNLTWTNATGTHTTTTSLGLLGALNSTAAVTSTFVGTLESQAVSSSGFILGSGERAFGMLSASGTVDFGATAAGTCDVITVTVTGARDRDPVYCGIPIALSEIDNYQAFTCYISAPDTVAIKRCNLTNAVTALSNPTATGVRPVIWQF